ncbi:hypothetical protein ACXGQW_10780 [Wenyingzhuangia sp. IMCC45533]
MLFKKHLLQKAIIVLFLGSLNLHLYSQSIEMDSSSVFDVEALDLKYHKAKKARELNELEAIKRSITSSTVIRGYRYDLNIDQLENILFVQRVNQFLKKQQTSIFNTSVLNIPNVDLNLKGNVNINGITQIVTIKGDLNGYYGKYNLQLTYHKGTNNVKYISRLLNERYQEGLALRLKINLGKEHKKKQPKFK